MHARSSHGKLAQMHAERGLGRHSPCWANEMASQPSGMEGFEQGAEVCFDSRQSGTPTNGVELLFRRDYLRDRHSGPYPENRAALPRAPP